MNSKRKGFKLKLICTSVIAVLLVAVSTAQLSSILLSNGNVVYAYSNSQAQSLNNECGNDGSSGINCVANGPQIQADGSATATPIVSNAGGRGEQGPAGPQGPPGIQGEQGPAGPKQELQVRDVDGEEVIVPAGGIGVASAQCAPDEVPTGGGLLTIDQDNTINPATEDGPISDGQGWAYVYNNAGNPFGIAIQVHLQCATLVNVP